MNFNDCQLRLSMIYKNDFCRHPIELIFCLFCFAGFNEKLSSRRLDTKIFLSHNLLSSSHLQFIRRSFLTWDKFMNKAKIFIWFIYLQDTHVLEQAAQFRHWITHFNNFSIENINHFNINNVCLLAIIQSVFRLLMHL